MIAPLDHDELEAIGGGESAAEVIVEAVNTLIKLVLRPFTTEG